MSTKDRFAKANGNREETRLKNKAIGGEGVGVAGTEGLNFSLEEGETPGAEG